jgi:hypothetical protein
MNGCRRARVYPVAEFKTSSNLMKNPFEKNDQTLLIAGVMIGAMAAGTAAYLLLTKTGAQVRRQISGQFSRIRNTFFSRRSEQLQAVALSYLQRKRKTPKTDREQLLRHEILHDPVAPHIHASEKE